MSSKKGLLILLFLFFKSLLADDREETIVGELYKKIALIGSEATKTKVNIFYQPYIISVYQGKQLEELGVTKLKEALELIAGIDMATDTLDNKTAVFRGSNPFAYGQSKLVIDGVVVNDLMYDSYAMYMEFPIELIKRIEVIRGPGGKIDGLNAYAGSIYVTTYSEPSLGAYKERIFAKVGSCHYRGLGFQKAFEGDTWNLYVDFYAQRDDKSLFAGVDALSYGIFGEANMQLAQRGEAPLWLKSFTFGVTMHWKNFSFIARTLTHQQGAAYGINAVLPRDEDKVSMPSTYLEGRWEEDVAGVKIKAKAGMKWDSFLIDSRALPPGFIYPSLSNPSQNVVFEDGFYLKDWAKQRTFYQGVSLYKENEKHDVEIGYEIKREETYDTRTYNTDRDDPTQGIVDYSSTYPFFDGDAYRNSLLLYIRDIWDMRDDLKITYGCNIEKNTHIDWQFNPRATLLYLIDERNIFKVMVSRSHRNPSWQELFTMNNKARVGNLALDPESVWATEINFVHRHSMEHFYSLTLFYLKNSDQITRNNPEHQYRNQEESTIYGIELEARRPLFSSVQLLANYTYTYALDGSGDFLANTARHMVKGAIKYTPFPNMALSLKALYVGPKERLDFDDRRSLPSYTKVDGSISYEDFRHHWRVQLIVNNLLDTKIYYPSEPMSYRSDFLQEGRNIIFSFIKEF